MGMLSRLLRIHTACTPAPVTPNEDLARLDASLDQLRKTAIEVSNAAIDATKALEEEHSRTKACFLALNSASDGIVILDDKANIYFCNDEFLDQNNIDHYKNVLGLHVTEVLPHIPKFSTVWKNVRQNKTQTIKCPESETVLTIVPMMNGEPQPIYYVCTFKSQVLVQ